jgi:hypothetical protein
MRKLKPKKIKNKKKSQNQIIITQHYFHTYQELSSLHLKRISIPFVHWLYYEQVFAHIPVGVAMVLCSKYGQQPAEEEHHKADTCYT